MNDTVVIITGTQPLHRRALAAVPSGAIVIAADGGLDHARAAGLVPAGLIGDLDSISPEGLAWAEANATIERHPEAKDDTDTELAIAFANAMTPARLILLAGGGDRLDHTLGAIGALGAPQLTSIPDIDCWWGEQHARVLHGPGAATLRAEPGSTLSVLALHGACSGVSLTGTRWELADETIAPLSGRGISNEVATRDHHLDTHHLDTLVHVRVSLGVLTVFFEPVGDGHPIPESDRDPATPHDEETTP